MDLIKKFEEYRARETQLYWSGSFADYLQMVTKNPHLAQLAHARIYNMIKDASVVEKKDHKKYNFFSTEIFGLDKAMERLVEEYFHTAARRLDVRKRILLLMGSVSGGKSTIVSMLKKGLEQYSRTDNGVVYSIKGCPMHEEPLHLIPKELRSQFEEEYGIYIEGELCPSCQMMLANEYDNCIEKVPVEKVVFSEEKRVGIGTFTPSDPKSQDIADLTGSIDFSTISEYGSESDPRAYRFDGDLNIANRGLMEFQEIYRAIQFIKDPTGSFFMKNRNEDT